MLHQRCGIRADLGRISVEDDLARQLALPGVEIFFFFQIGYGNDLRGYRSVGSRRPWRSLRDKDGCIRLDHINRSADLAPAQAELTPALQVSIGASHRSELVTRPRVCFG